MKEIILATLLVFGSSINIVTALNSTKDVVCYVATWKPDIINKVDNNLCSIFILAFGTLDGQGNVGVPDNFANFKSLKTSTSKLMLALGGANAGTSIFKQNAATAASRAKFTENCLNLVKNYGLDGIDIDWEFPNSEDRTTFVALHQELKDRLGNNYIVSTAVSVGQWLVVTNNVYDIGNLAKSVDFINLMAYDMHMDQSWDSSFGVYFNAPIKANSGDSVDKGINLFLQGGAPANKLVVGIPFYGRQYQLADSAKTSPTSPFTGSHQNDDSYKPAYNEYCPKISDSSWTKKRDELASAPYMFSGDKWLAYEDEQSVTDKAKLASTYNLRGVMLWVLHQDDYDGVCGSCKWPLLNAMNVAVERISVSSACKNSISNGDSGKSSNSKVDSGKSSNSNVDSGKSSNSNVDSGKTNSTDNGKTGNTTPNKCTSAGLHPHPQDCSKYLSCVNVGTDPYVMSCATGLLWNNHVQACDYTCVA